MHEILKIYKEDLDWFDEKYREAPTNVEEYFIYSSMISNAINKAQEVGFSEEAIRLIVALGIRNS